MSEVEEIKAELKDWVVKNCLLDKVSVDKLVNKMYAEVKTAKNNAKTFDQVQAEYLVAKRLATEANAKVVEIKELRDRLCPHTEMKPQEFYCSGTYYDAAYSEYWYECVCCGKTTPRKNERHTL